MVVPSLSKYKRTSAGPLKKWHGPLLVSQLSAGFLVKWCFRWDWDPTFRLAIGSMGSLSSYGDGWECQALSRGWLFWSVNWFLLWWVSRYVMICDISFGTSIDGMKFVTRNSSGGYTVGLWTIAKCQILPSSRYSLCPQTPQGLSENGRPFPSIGQWSRFKRQSMTIIRGKSPVHWWSNVNRHFPICAMVKTWFVFS